MRALILLLLLAVAAVPGLAAPDSPDSAGQSAPPSVGVDKESPHQRIKLLIRDGKLAEAEAEARALVSAREKTNGSESLETAKALEMLGEALVAANKTSDPEALALAERAFQIRERTQGLNHPDLSLPLALQSRVLKLRGQYVEALEALDRAISLTEKTCDLGDPGFAILMNDKANLLRRVGRYAEARELHETILASREKLLGPEHLDVAMSLQHLGVACRDLGDLESSRRYLERALTINEAALPVGAPNVLKSMISLANTLRDLGDFEACRRLISRELALAEEIHGAQSLHFARGLGVLMTLEGIVGDPAKAVDAGERSLKIIERVSGPEHSDTGAAFYNLGLSRNWLGDPAQAALDLRRALEIWVRAHGPSHPRVSMAHERLATTLLDMGRLDEAAIEADSALAVAERAVGSEHRYVATSLSTLAAIRAKQGRWPEALGLEERAVGLAARAYGPEHPRAIEIRLTLPTYLYRSLHYDRALDESVALEESWSRHARLTCLALPERAALRYQYLYRNIDVALTVLADGKASPDAVRRVWDAALRSRGAVSDALAERHRWLSAYPDPDLQPLLERVTEARRQLASLLVRTSGDDEVEGLVLRLAEARSEVDAAERALAAGSEDFRIHAARAEIGYDEVARSLPPGTALVRYVKFERLGKTADTMAYSAFVLTSEGDPVAIQLGAASRIDSLAATWRTEVVDAAQQDPEDLAAREPTCRKAGAALRAAVFDPLLPHLGGTQRVFLVPTDVLEFVVLGALPAPGQDQRYMAESGPEFHILSTERDLVPITGNRKRADLRVLLLADPDYDATRAPSARPSPSAANVASLDVAPPLVSYTALPAPYRGPHSQCPDFTKLQFERLPATRHEVAEIQKALRGQKVDLLQDVDATEPAFKHAASGHQILHLATHGFFLSGTCAPAPPSGTRGLGTLITPSVNAPAARESHLILSGLALAGANRRQSAGPEDEDGILTAEEIAALDLTQADWVVLSGCDTGLGDLHPGDEILGLRRAFAVAGARTLIMSLWAVRDADAREWMQALYQGRLGQSLDTPDAISHAHLARLQALRARGESTHPATWAAFVAAGDWR